MMVVEERVSVSPPHGCLLVVCHSKIRFPGEHSVLVSCLCQPLCKTSHVDRNAANALKWVVWIKAGHVDILGIDMDGVPA